MHLPMLEVERPEPVDELPCRGQAEPMGIVSHDHMCQADAAETWELSNGLHKGAHRVAGPDTRVEVH
jgi:hypothetical protein